MSRGISTYQRRVVEEPRKRGTLTTFDVTGVLLDAKEPFEADDPELLRVLRPLLWRKSSMSGRFDEPHMRDARQSSSVYRTTCSLVKRGLVAELLNVRPKEYFPVKRRKGRPWVRILPKCSTKAVLLLKEKGRLTFRTRDKLYDMSNLLLEPFPRTPVRPWDRSRPDA
ncbi:MAG: hypothetical protein JRN45_00275 [Nitrososphaerota archaeon]|nr:hypothetical protein [Nitrososphaerota archaeon]